MKKKKNKVLKIDLHGDWRTKKMIKENKEAIFDEIVKEIKWFLFREYGSVKVYSEIVDEKE